MNYAVRVCGKGEAVEEWYETESEGLESYHDACTLVRRGVYSYAEFLEGDTIRACIG